MASKPKKYEYFTYETVDIPPDKDRFGAKQLSFVLLVGFVIISVPALLFGNNILVGWTAISILFILLIYIKLNPTKRLTPSKAQKIVENRAVQREHFANVNNLQYEYEVKLDPMIEITNDDYIANHYISGIISGITFWNADTVYTYERYGDYEQYAQMIKQNATAVFVDNELPTICIVENSTLSEERSFKLTSGKPTTIKITQQFDKKYTTFVPKGYERDALYILTAELLELILKYGPSAIEIEKQRIIIHRFDAVESEKDYQTLAEMIQELGAEFIDNTKRYQDSRSKVKNKVAKAGTIVKI